MNYLLDDLMGFEKTADRKIRYDHNGKTMFLELIGSSDTDANIKNHLDGAKRSGIKAQVVPWDTPYEKPKAGQEKTAAWLVNKEKKQRVKAMKFLGHQLERENRDAQSYKSKADALRPQEGALWSQLERVRKLHDDDFNARFKAQELKEQLRPEEYVKDPLKKIRERASLSFDGPHYDNLRKADREHSEVYGKLYDYDDNVKRHRQSATNLENDIKSQAKRYAEDFFGPNPTRKKALQRKERLIVGAGVGTAAALGGGAYLYNRYKKKKREMAEQDQEKTAANNLKEGGLMTAGGIGLTAASLYGSLALQKRLKEKYGDIDGVNETSFLSGIGNDKASNRIYPTKEQRERAEKFRKSFNRLNFGSRVGFGVGGGLAVGGASMLADAVSRR